MMNKERVNKISRLYKLAFESSGILQNNPDVTTYSTREQSLEQRNLKATTESDNYKDFMENQPKLKIKEPKDVSSAQLSTRYWPGLVGVQRGRVDDDHIQNPYTGEIRNLRESYKSEDGRIFPGGSVSLQTKV
jgi:hypothetical protein